MTESKSSPDLLDNLAHEFAERYRRGERPALGEYAEQYPELASQIRDIFPALMMMEQFGSVAGEMPAGTSDHVPQQLGEYRILREVGRGGMGVVYEAFQESLGRHVALKVLPLHRLVASKHRERFEREAKVAARLHHTNIVPVFGIGENDGLHYYAMQYIQGQALDAVLNEVRRLRAGNPPGPCPTATVSIAQGLLAGAHASPHQPSPANGEGVLTQLVAAGGAMGERTHQPQLLAPAEARGVPVMDVTQDSAAEGLTSGVTSSSATTSVCHLPTNGQSELTGSSEARYFAAVANVGIQVAEALAYAHSLGVVHRDIKPSNLLLDAHGNTWITDFGLVKDEGSDDLTGPGDIVGTIRYMAPERFNGQGDARSDIYSLGATLYEMLTLTPAFQGEQRAELIDRVRHQEPRGPRLFDASIPRDLETVVLKAMAKEPERRYQNASELAEDLGRFLGDRPVLARRSTLRERTWRWCRRNPMVASLIATVAVLLVTLLAGALLDNFRLQEQLTRAEKAEKERGEQLARAENAEREKTDRLWDSYLASAQASRWSGRPGRRFDGLAAVRNAAAIRPHLRLRNEAIALLTLPDVRIVREVPKGISSGDAMAGFAFDADLEKYARSDLMGNITIRRVSDDHELICLPGDGTHAWSMKFSPDGKYLTTLYDKSGMQRLWEWSTKHIVLEAPIAGQMDFGPDSTMAAIGRTNGTVAIHELPSGKLSKELRIGEPSKIGHTCAYHPDGKIIAVEAREIGHTKIIDLATGNVIRGVTAGTPRWQQGGTRLAITAAGRITIWDTRTWQLEQTLKPAEGAPSVACFSSRDDLVVSGGLNDSSLRLWDVVTGRQQFALPGSFLVTPQFDRKSELLAATRAGPTVHMWEVAGSDIVRTLRSPMPMLQTTWGAQFSNDGAFLATAGEGGVRVWDVATRQNVASLPIQTCSGAVFAPDGRWLFTRTKAGIQRWPVLTNGSGLRVGEPELVARLPFNGHTGTLVSAPEGKLAVNIREDGTVCLLDPNDAKNLVTLQNHPRTTNRLAVSGDGRWVAATTWWDLPDKLRVSDVQSGEVVFTHPVRTPGEFSPDSRWLVTGGEACQIWKTGTWQLERTITAPPGLGNVIHAAYSPDGLMIAIGYENRAVHLVDARTGAELATLPTPDLPAIDRLCFNPDGSVLACTIDLIGVQLWDLHRIRAELKNLKLDWSLPGESVK